MISFLAKPCTFLRRFVIITVHSKEHKKFPMTEKKIEAAQTKNVFSGFKYVTQGKT